MNLLPRLLIFSLLTTALAIGTACTVQPGNSNAPVTQASPLASSAASTSASPSATQASVQVTLPLLDALLADDAFVRELKNKLKLSDDQIDSLKHASQTEIDRLRASNAEKTDTDGTDAPTRAAQQLRSILGEEKATQLASLANEYWAKGAPDTSGEGEKSEQFQMLKGPNAVPADTRVVVNIPAFRMDLFQNGSLVKTYKVGIGYPEFPLPLGLRKAQSVIFNPPWTPPDSPWVAKMKNATPGETIEPGSKDNPLGPIKIPIGLPSLIHGGKSPAKIGKFASHGCVGLTTPQVKDFAALLLRAANSDVSEQEINSYLADKTRTKSVKLANVIPVELRYETIVLEDGKLHIYKDVYAQHTNTEENLRRVLEANGARLEDLSEEQRQQALDALKSQPKNEVVIDVPSLAQKGYPVAVNLDDGKGKPQITPSKKKKSA
ncbi:MAG TPA: L,D-transpeptidase [Pyrinomonadaceae bacterium]|jgi:lipoprotein-anchoring transpeptidase ErfK/SrfK